METKKLKVGVIADPPLVTHSCAVVAGQLAKQWVKQGHEVHYLGYAYRGEIIDHKDGYKIYPDIKPCTTYESVKNFIEQCGGLDIIYAHGSKDIFRGGILAAREKGIPYVPHTFYSSPYKNDKVNTFEAKSGFILYDCEDVNDLFVCNNFSVGVGFALGKRTWLVPNGVDEDIFFPHTEGNSNDNYRRELGIPNTAFVFLFSGSNLSGKDPGRALVAFAKFWHSLDLIERQHAYLAMHTRPADSEDEKKRGMVQLRKEAYELGVGENVKFFSDAFPEWLEDTNVHYTKTAMSPPYTNTPYELMGNVYRTGDVQLVTTLMEGMSTTILEGQACGLPVICNDDPVVSEPIIPYVTGLLVHRLLTNESVTDEIVDRMRELFFDRSMTKQMSINASNHIKLKYNWKYLAKHFTYLFYTLINKKYD